MMSSRISLKKAILLIIAFFIIVTTGTIFGLKSYFYFQNKNIQPNIDASAVCNRFQRLANLHWTQANNYKSEQIKALQENRQKDWVTWTQKYELEKSVAEDIENQYQNCKTNKKI